MKTAFERHDHGACADAAMARATDLAAARGLRLTPVRRRVLEILLERHRALGAYEVLERLAAEGLGKQPPVAYRALAVQLRLPWRRRASRQSGQPGHWPHARTAPPDRCSPDNSPMQRCTAAWSAVD